MDNKLHVTGYESLHFGFLIVDLGFKSVLQSTFRILQSEMSKF